MKILFLAGKSSIQGKVILKYLVSKNIKIDAVGLCRYGFPTRNYKKEFRLVNQIIRKDGIIRFFSRVFKIILNNIYDKINYKLKINLSTKRINNNHYAEETVLSIATESNIKVITTYNHNDIKFVNRIKKLKPDLIILCGADILEKDIMEIPPKGCINFHSSLLPKYRGGSPIFWQLWFKDIVGVTIHFIDEKIDKGDIILQSEVEVKRGDNIDSLHLRACEVGRKLIYQAINKINDGTVIRKTQHNLEGSYYKNPTKEEEKLLGAKLLERWEENKV